jgi:hypothetical protein
VREPPRIRVKRPKALGENRAASTVLVDGEVVGRLKNGEAAEVTVTPGVHRVEARIQWFSTAVEVDCREGDYVAIECTSPRNSFRGYSHVARGRRDWLRLRPVDPAAPVWPVYVPEVPLASRILTVLTAVLVLGATYARLWGVDWPVVLTATAVGLVLFAVCVTWNRRTLG